MAGNVPSGGRDRDNIKTITPTNPEGLCFQGIQEKEKTTY